MEIRLFNSKELPISLNESEKTIAKHIKETRNQRGMSQEYVAEKLGISQNAYSKIELGYCKITVKRMFEIYHILGKQVSVTASKDLI